MANKPRYKTSFGFIDLLFNLLVGFTFLFILAFILINPVAKKYDFDPKAEYLIIVNWDPNSASDIDSWIKDNNSNVVGFRNKDFALMNLDRDDLGFSNDTMVDPTGKISQVKINREVISIRSNDPRTYTVTVHWYRNPTQSVTQEEVTVELIKVNPYFVVKEKKIVLTKEGQEVHLFEIKVNTDKSIEVNETGDLIFYNPNNLRKKF